MIIEKIKYENDSDREAIINENSDLFLIKEECHLDGNFLTFTDVKPLEKPSINEVVEDQGKKISILESENEALNTKLDTVKYTHSDLILDMDFRIMDIEDNLGIVPMKINLLNRIGDNDMNSTFMLVLDKIEMGNYKNKEEIESICDRYLARNRITEEEYDTLMKALDKKEAEKNSVES